MIRNAAALVLAAGLSSAALAATPAHNNTALKAAQTEAKSTASARLGPVLNALYKSESPAAKAGASAKAQSFAKKTGRLRTLLRAQDGTVRINIALKGDAAAEQAAFASYGLKDISVYGNHISGRVPISALATIGKHASVISVRPALSMNRAGLTTTQGDRAQRSKQARNQFDLTGAGVTVGVLSDSVNCRFTPLTDDPAASFTTYAQDVANGDLSRVRILKDLPEPDCSEIGTDEGRAMLQLVHDVAPGAKLSYYTAGVDETDFAIGILKLALAGANVIVDDTIYFAEPMFQDGVISQAIDSVKSAGVLYLSSAGNNERQSYEAPYKASAGTTLHNFGTKRNPDNLQLATLDPSSLSLLSFQWDEPYASISPTRGSRSDLDIAFLDANGNLIPPCNDDLEPAVCQFPGVDANEGADPIEIAAVSNSTDSSVDVNIVIDLFSGPAPHLMKYVWFDLADGLFHLDEYNTDSSTVYGHVNAAGAEAIGAAPWYNTAEWGSPLWGNACKPACLEYFSSAGGTPILFNEKGKRFPIPVIRLKPGVTGPDGGNTSFFFARSTDPAVGGGEPDQYPNFFGTSASAPHVAGIAALMLEQMKHNEKVKGPGLKLNAKKVPDFLISTLRATSGDIKKRAARTIAPYPIEHPNGYDFDSGFGYVDAVKAITVVKALRATSN
jgi:subtilisin family serine protease